MLHRFIIKRLSSLFPGLPLSLNSLSSKKKRKKTISSDWKRSYTWAIIFLLFSFSFSLLIMVFINYGGGGYYFFQHSKWNGLTVADLVFPWFVWIMGVSVVFSFQGRKKDSFLHQLYQIIRRTVLLFALGLFLISNNSGT